MAAPLFPRYRDGDRVRVGKFDQPGQVVGDPWRSGDDWLYPLLVGTDGGGYPITLAGRFLRPAPTPTEGEA